MKLKLFVTFLAAVLAITACAPSTPAVPTVNVDAIYTSAARTVVAEITLTAAAFTDTPQPTATEELLPTATLIAGLTETSGEPVASGTAILCDDLQYIEDVNIPDNSEMTPGQDFVKTWKVKNNGSCAWGAGYVLIYGGYTDKMSGQPVPIEGVVSVGQEVEISVNFKAPTDAGEYLSVWRMANDRNIPFGTPVYVKVIVR